jgi:hypothetical protein
MITLTRDQFEKLLEYFEFALVAVSDEEQEELVFMEKPLRDMLREISRDQTETLSIDADRTDRF